MAEIIESEINVTETNIPKTAIPLEKVAIRTFTPPTLLASLIHPNPHKSNWEAIWHRIRHGRPIYIILQSLTNIALSSFSSYRRLGQSQWTHHLVKEIPKMFAAFYVSLYVEKLKTVVSASGVMELEDVFSPAIVKSSVHALLAMVFSSVYEISLTIYTSETNWVMDAWAWCEGSVKTLGWGLGRVAFTALAVAAYQLRRDLALHPLDFFYLVGLRAGRLPRYQFV
jgi:hypothetical protein